MRVDITTYKEDGSELITRRYDFEEHENDVAADAIQDILDDSREYLEDREKSNCCNAILTEDSRCSDCKDGAVANKFDNDEELIEQELEEHLNKIDDEAEKQGDNERENE